MSTLGQRIRELRNKVGMSQADLAFEMQGGGTTISQYENDKREPKLSDLQKLHEKLAATLGDNYFYLLTGNHPTSEFFEQNIKTQYVKREDIINLLSEFVSEMVEIKEIRLSPRLKPTKFASMFMEKKLAYTNQSEELIKANGS
jgi:transcriptional regulator with XRE-family HTH domain